MHQSGEQEMANKYGRQRADNNTNRKKYESKYDERGKKGPENMVIRSFWRENKMEDIIKLGSKKLDQVIDNMLENYQKIQIKRDPNWWYPEEGRTLSQSRYKKKIDKE